MAKRVNGSVSHGKKNRKWGRNKVWCEMYRKLGRRTINKRRKLTALLKKQPYNKQIKQALKRLDAVA